MFFDKVWCQAVVVGLLVLTFNNSLGAVSSKVIEIVSFNSTTFAANKTVPISLVVPTVYAEVKCLSVLLRSLVESTSFPSETIIVASGDSARFVHEIDTLKATLANMSSSLPNVKLVLLKGLHQQAQGRNIGANLSTNDIVSFFDGDDFLHPQRFDILHRIYVENPEVDVVLHTWDTFVYEETIHPGQVFNTTIILRPKDVQKRYEALGWKIGKSVTHWEVDYKRMYLIWVFPEFPTIANGWSTMKRKVISAVPAEPVRGAEDSVHNGEIIIRGYNVMAINSQLGYYRKRVGRRKTC